MHIDNFGFILLYCQDGVYYIAVYCSDKVQEVIGVYGSRDTCTVLLRHSDTFLYYGGYSGMVVHRHFGLDLQTYFQRLRAYLKKALQE